MFFLDSKRITFSLLSLLQKIGLVGVVGIVLGLLGVLVAPHMPSMRDFDQTFYPAIRYALAGQNPYTSYYQVTDQGTPPAFYSPPWFLVILFPFGLLPFEIARAEWMIFLIGVTLSALGLMGWWGLNGPWAMALVVLPWSLVGILYGQPTALVLLGAVLAISQIAQGQANLPSGLLILLGLILVGLKPQLGLFIALPLGLWLFWRRDRRLPLIVGGGCIFLLWVWLLPPPWLGAIFANSQMLPAPHWQSTLERELLLWQMPTWIAHAVRLGVIVSMLVWAWREKKLTSAWWAAMLTTVLIITPYTRAYDGVLLLPILGQMIIQYKLHFLIFVIVVVTYTSLPLGELGSVFTPFIAWLVFVPWSRLFLAQPDSTTP